jgi:hypothetical protein
MTLIETMPAPCVNPDGPDITAGILGLKFPVEVVELISRQDLISLRSLQLNREAFHLVSSYKLFHIVHHR